jgi:Zn finger protein HypA/HybF involved in hydrogenase expression
VPEFWTLGDMKSIASLEVDFAAGLLERLKKEAIPFEIRPVTQESGLEYGDVMVADDYYERACDVAEAWEAERLAEAERRSNRHCPTCGSSHLENAGADSFSISIWKCKDCGNAFARS